MGDLVGHYENKCSQGLPSSTGSINSEILQEVMSCVGIDTPNLLLGKFDSRDKSDTQASL